MKVIVCGSRTWTEYGPVWKRLEKLLEDVDGGGLVIVHGGARGADAMAHRWASAQEDVKEIEYKADWDQFGKSAGYRRNREMMDGGADLVIAFRSAADVDSPGTDMMLGIAERDGTPCEVIHEFTT